MEAFLGVSKTPWSGLAEGSVIPWKKSAEPSTARNPTSNSTNHRRRDTANRNVTRRDPTGGSRCNPARSRDHHPVSRIQPKKSCPRGRKKTRKVTLSTSHSFTLTRPASPSRRGRRRLAVGFAAVFYGEDQDGIAEIVEAHAVVADAEAELWRLNVLEVLDIAYAGGEITSTIYRMRYAGCEARWLGR
jgi:hypothetical protein